MSTRIRRGKRAQRRQVNIRVQPVLYEALESIARQERRSLPTRPPTIPPVTKSRALQRQVVRLIGSTRSRISTTTVTGSQSERD